MLAASLIDVDEKIIPDALSRPGTLAGLLLAAIWPWSLLPDVQPFFLGKWSFKFLCVTSPNAWPAWLDGAPNCGSLAIGLACWALWCLAIMPRTWYARRGRLKALALCWNRVVRQADTYRILCMGVTGVLLISFVWYRGGDNWTALLSALVGMAAGGGVIWAVRIIGRGSRSRGHGLWRRHADEHDRRVPGLATLPDHFFPGPFCGPGRGLAAVFLPPRPRNPLRPVSMPGRLGRDFILGPDLGLGPRHLRPGLVRVPGHARLPDAHGPAVVFTENDFQRFPCKAGIRTNWVPCSRLPWTLSFLLEKWIPLLMHRVCSHRSFRCGNQVANKIGFMI